MDEANPSEADPRAQLSYQVRFDWGAPGAAALAASDVLVWVDELRGADATPVPAHPGPAHPGLVEATQADAATVVERVLAEQTARGGRVYAGIVAAGVVEHDGLRFAVEDLLAAGAIIDALAEAGIDHTSPEAAAAGAAYAGLKRATNHLRAASVSARQAARR